MKIIAETGKKGLATVFLAKTAKGKLLEFVESLQPPFKRDEKWVLIISTLYGCPVACAFCDAGNHYHGKISKQELIDQIDFLIRLYYPDAFVRVKKFKIQFARMGEPSFNPAVLDVLEELPSLYDIPGFIPSVSTVAPCGTEAFFEKLLHIKKTQYREHFQFQFSIHTSDLEKRNWLIPVKTWPFEQMAAYGEKFFDRGGKKITLNFVLSKSLPLDEHVVAKYFSPEYFIIKLSPLNPTYKAQENHLQSSLQKQEQPMMIQLFKALGFEVILNTGEWEENKIGSNCGQYISCYNKSPDSLKEAYTYQLREHTL